MDSNIVGSSIGVLTVATDKFNALYAAAGGWGTALTSQSVMPTAGTLKQFYVKMDTTNPSGKTFAIYKNGVDQALTITIPNGSTSGNDTTHTVTYAAGDTISLHATGGDGTTNVGIVRWTLAATQTTGSMILSSSNAAMGTVFPVYIAPQGNNSDPTAGTNVEAIIPSAGTIKNAYVTLNSAIASGTDLTFTLFLNGVGQSLAVTLNLVNGLQSFNDTNAGHAVTVAAGDKLYWKVTSTVAPASKTAFVSAEFDPTTVGESVHMYGGSKAQPTGTAIKYNTPGESNLSFTTTEANAQVLSQVAVWKNLYVLEQTSIATGSLKYQTQKNASATGPSVTITTGTTGNDTSNTTTTAAGDTISIGVTPTNPTVSLGEWGIVSYIAPAAAATVKQLSALGVG